MKRVDRMASSSLIDELAIAELAAGELGGAGQSERHSKIEIEVTELFERFRPSLLRYSLSFGLSMPDGEEIVQEVFLALFRHLQLGRSRQNLRGWIFRVAHNLALKQTQTVRTRRDRREILDGTVEQQLDPGPNPEEILSAARRQERLSAVVKALPEQDRRCLVLRAEGLRYREIASVLGISLGSVSTSLTQSMERLQRADRR